MIQISNYVKAAESKSLVFLIRRERYVNVIFFNCRSAKLQKRGVCIFFLGLKFYHDIRSTEQ